MLGGEGVPAATPPWSLQCVRENHPFLLKEMSGCASPLLFLLRGVTMDSIPEDKAPQ